MDNKEKFQYIIFVVKAGWTLEGFLNLTEDEQNEILENIVKVLTGEKE